MSTEPTAGGVRGRPKPEDLPLPEPNTQAPWRPSLRLPAFLQQFPSLLGFRPSEPDEHAPLISPRDLEETLAGMDPAVVRQVQADVHFLEYELLRLFRQRDHQAKYQQNRYRRYQVLYLMLATVATLVGSGQALALMGKPEWLPVLALVETLIALVATFFAALGGRESPMPLWLSNRRKAEELRREYFRYLLRLPPYDTVQGHRLAMLLSQRAADISRGAFPDGDTTTERLP